MSYPLQQASTTRPLLFLLVDSADHLSPKTGLSPTVTLSKNGAAFGAPAGAVSELGSGWYQVAANATDTNTLGVLLLHATATGADVCDVQYEVVSFNPHDAVRLGLTALPNAAAEAAGGLFTRGAGAGQLNQNANGQVDTRTVAMATDVVTAAAIATDAIGSAELAASAVSEIAAAIGGGGGGGLVGAGSIPVTITVTRVDGVTPLEGVGVWVSTDAAGTSVVAGTLYTDENGHATFMLDAGNYYVWRQRGGENFANPTAITVTS